MVTEVALCDLCGRDLARAGHAFSVGPLDFCRRCRGIGVCPWHDYDPTALVNLWAGNCRGCWEQAMALPRGVCRAQLYTANPSCQPMAAPHDCGLPHGHAGSCSCDCGHTWALTGLLGLSR